MKSSFVKLNKSHRKESSDISDEETNFELRNYQDKNYEDTYREKKLMISRNTTFYDDNSQLSRRIISFKSNKSESGLTRKSVYYPKVEIVANADIKLVPKLMNDLNKALVNLNTFKKNQSLPKLEINSHSKFISSQNRFSQKNHQDKQMRQTISTNNFKSPLKESQSRKKRQTRQDANHDQIIVLQNNSQDLKLLEEQKQQKKLQQAIKIINNTHPFLTNLIEPLKQDIKTDINYLNELQLESKLKEKKLESLKFQTQQLLKQFDTEELVAKQKQFDEKNDKWIQILEQTEFEKEKLMYMRQHRRLDVDKIKKPVFDLVNNTNPKITQTIEKRVLELFGGNKKVEQILIDIKQLQMQASQNEKVFDALRSDQATREKNKQFIEECITYEQDQIQLKQENIKKELDNQKKQLKRQQLDELENKHVIYKIYQDQKKDLMEKLSILKQQVKKVENFSDILQSFKQQRETKNEMVLKKQNIEQQINQQLSEINKLEQHQQTLRLDSMNYDIIKGEHIINNGALLLKAENELQNAQISMNQTKEMMEKTQNIYSHQIKFIYTQLEKLYSLKVIKPNIKSKEIKQQKNKSFDDQNEQQSKNENQDESVNSMQDCFNDQINENRKTNLIKNIHKVLQHKLSLLSYDSTEPSNNIIELVKIFTYIKMSIKQVSSLDEN